MSRIITRIIYSHIHRCPGCLTKTCSLTCLNTHKEILQCNGKKSRTAFVPMNEMKINTLTEDLSYLENSKNVVTQAVCE